MMNIARYENKGVEKQYITQFMIDSYEKNKMSCFSNPQNTVNGMYLNIGNYYFLDKGEDSNSSKIWNKFVNPCELNNGEKCEVWVTIPLVFPIATLHSINSSCEHLFSESVGGSLCFSPEEINVSRLFSSIQGLSDIGASFFQIVIAKLESINANNIALIQEEFMKVFNEESIINKSMIPLKPIGWRRKTESKNNSTIPIKRENSFEDYNLNKIDAFYNARLVLENRSEEFKETLLRLANLLDIFLNKIKLIIPSLEIIKVTELYKDDFFEVTIRLQTMPSYVSTEGEDFDIKEIKYSSINESKEDKNTISSVYLGDIRLVNPYKLEVDNRTSCGLFKTFSLISENSLFQLSGCMATYIPLVCNRKKRNNQTNFCDKTDNYVHINTKQSIPQFLDQNQNKFSTPKLFNFCSANKENNIKTPPPTNLLSNNSTKCVSTNSTCDFRYKHTTNNNWSRKSCTYTPTTKASLNKVSYTPFSSSTTEIDSSPWLNNDQIIPSSSIFTCEQENQQLIPPRISSLSCTSNYCRSENNLLLFNPNTKSNSINESTIQYDLEISFEENSLIKVNKDTANNFKYDHIESSLFYNKKLDDRQMNRLDLDKSQNKISRESFDHVELLDSCSIQSSENKDFDIINMLENIFSDNLNINSYNDDKQEKNLYNCQNILSKDIDENKNNCNQEKRTELKHNQIFCKNVNSKFDLWGMELFNNSQIVSSEELLNNLTKIEKVSEFAPNEFINGKKCVLF